MHLKYVSHQGTNDRQQILSGELRSHPWAGEPKGEEEEVGECGQAPLMDYPSRVPSLKSLVQGSVNIFCKGQK